MKKQILLPFLILPLFAACNQKEASAPAAPPAPQSALPAPAPALTPEAPPPAPAPTPEAAPAAPVAGGGLAKGEDVYKKTCSVCHATGVAGAPKLGNKAEWQPRIAQGTAVLYGHAIKGFTGSKGVMPPKGGNLALSDEEVKAGVDYMAAQAK